MGIIGCTSIASKTEEILKGNQSLRVASSPQSSIGGRNIHQAKVLLIGTEWVPIPPIRGGALEVWVYEIAKRLQNLGYEVSIVSASDPTLPSSEFIDGIDIHRISTLFSQRIIIEQFLGHCVYCLGASLEAAMIEKDIIHIQNVYRMVPIIKTTNSRVPVIISVQNIPLLRNISALCYKMADAIHVASKFMKTFLTKEIRGVNPTKIRVIPNGVEIDVFAPNNKGDVRERLGIGTAPMVLYVGRIHPTKGVDVLVDAVPKVLKQFPEAKFVFIGPQTFARAHSGSNFASTRFYKNAVKQFSENESIIYLGPINDRNKLAQFYASADIFVCPEVWQAPGGTMTIIEAMACGRAVIASNVGGIPELIENKETGILVPAGDSKVLAENIISLLKNDELRMKMGKSCRSKAEKSFSWDQVAEKVSKMYEEVLLCYG